MNILHINSNYRYSALHSELIVRLNTQGISNRIFMPIHEHSEKDFVHVPFSEIDSPISFKRNDRFFFFLKQRKIRNIIKNQINVAEFNIIHAHTLFTDGYAAYRLHNEYKIPYIVAVRNTDINIFFKKRIFLKKLGVEILKNASSIIFLSKVHYEEVMNSYIPEMEKANIDKKVEILPNGIDKFWLENKNRRNYKDNFNKIKLIYTGRINTNKNIRTTIESCEILLKKGYDINFTIVGKIDDQQEYKRIQNYSFINYHVQQPKDKLIDFYRSSDIFIMPSLRETFGLVYAEAMSQGLPIIYSKGQGFDKQFPDGVVGFPVNKNDAKDIAVKIEKIINNYENISKKCLDLCDVFDWDKITAQYIAIYEKINTL